MSTQDACEKQVGYPQLVWRIGVAMAEAGIRTNRELKKRLAETGYLTSEATLCRLRKVDLRAIDLEMLAALCAVLGAMPNDLLAPKGGWPTKQSREVLRVEPAPKGHSGKDDLPVTDASMPDLPKLGASSMLGPRIKPVSPIAKTKR